MKKTYNSQKDDFLNHLRGLDKLDQATRDATELFTETMQFKDNLFPPLEQPTSPGYVTYNKEYFQIYHPNKILSKNLEEYFTDRDTRRSVYNFASDLSEFFEFIFFGLLVDGYYASPIKWEKKIVGNRYYILPTFYFQDAATVKAKKSGKNIKSVSRIYSIWTYLNNKYARPKRTVWAKNEVFYLEYPYSKKSPTIQSLKYLPILKKFLLFGVNQAKGMAEPNNHSLKVELARYKSFREIKREQDIARGRVRKNFNYLYEDSRLTNYYDTYFVTRNKKFLNNIRSYLIKQFNDQVFAEIAVRNGFSHKPHLELIEGLFPTNQELDKILADYHNKKVSLDDYINITIKKNG